MKTSFPRVIIRAALFAALVLPAAGAFAQTSGSSYRNTPTDVEIKSQIASKLISKAEAHFTQAILNLQDNKIDQARSEFDQAVEVILVSGIDVRSVPELQQYYWELAKRINCIEVPGQPDCRGVPTPQLTNGTLTARNQQVNFSGQSQEVQEGTKQQEPGFKHQKFEPSPLDEYAKLVLTPEEQNVDSEDVADIEIAKNTLDLPIETNPLIQQFINFYQGRGRSTMESGIRRSGQFMQMARKIFREEGVPEDITWLGQVESAWRPKAMSWAAASGLWQFIPGTGRTYGLRQTAWLDERNGFEKATRASARYLKDLYQHFGDWQLAMAAYNTGQGNIDRAISRAGSRSYWKIFPYIAQETRNYVPAILATMLIAKNPEKYGFRGVRPDPPLSYDVVEVPTATSLHLVAQTTGTSVDYIRMLNPELRRDVTPRGEAYRLRIPGGRADQFVAALKSIPAERRDSAPGGNNVQLASYKRATTSGATPAAPGMMKVKARAGDTPSRLATIHNVSAEEIAKMNGVGVDSQFEAGKEVLLPKAAPSSSTRRRSGR